MTRSYIGVTTEVSVQSSPTNTSVPSGRFQIAGITEKGPLNYPAIIRSINQYSSIFGGRTPYDTLYDTVRTYFQEGGAELYVTRVVGANATNGSVIISSAAETPEPLVNIEVKDPGAHSAQYEAVVETNTDNTFNLRVVDTSSLRVLVSFARAESPADLASLALGSDIVTVRALAETGIPPKGAYRFSEGNDDRAAIDDAAYGAALTAHKGIRAGVAVACPGREPSLTFASMLGEHCWAKGKIGLLEVPADHTIEEAKALGQALLGNAAYGSYLSMPLYPAIRVPDGSDRSRTVGPAGYVAAQRSIVHRQVSFAAAVAGPRTKTMWNFYPVRRLDNEDVNALNQAGINAIYNDAGAPYLNNWSSLSAETGLYDLNVQDTLNNLTVLLETGLSTLIWRPNEGRDMLTSEAASIVAGIMQPLVTGGWLYPNRGPEGGFVDNGYTVDVEDIRTSGQPSPYDELVVNVGIRLSPTLRHIHVPIRKVDLRMGF